MQVAARTRKLATAAALLLPLGALLAAQAAHADARDVDRWRGWEAGWRQDRRAPDIRELTPGQGGRVGERGLTQIAARYTDDRSGIDPRSVVLRVDGRDVTGRARVDRDDVRYAGDLRPGRHFAELLVRDRAGNLARRAWSFEVLPEGPHGHREGSWNVRS